MVHFGREFDDECILEFEPLHYIWEEGFGDKRKELKMLYCLGVKVEKKRNELIKIMLFRS